MKLLMIIFLITVLLLLSTVHAGAISITTTLQDILVQEKNAQASIQLSNSGDEAASNFEVSFILPEGVGTKTISLDNLSPNETLNRTFNITVSRDLLEGIYSIAVLVKYTDANDYSFSAVSPSYLIYKTSTRTNIFGSIPELSLTGKESKNLDVTLRNLDDKQHNLKIRLIIPLELKVEIIEKNLTIDKKTESKLSFPISNFGALVGSNYIVLASIEYEENNLHYSSIAIGNVKIEEETTTSSFPPYIIVIIVLVLIVLLAAFLKLSKRK
jgi:hypothetical protein